MVLTSIATSKKLSYRLYNTHYCFAPSLWMSLLTLLTLGLFIKLGMWQLQRATEKQALIERYQHNSQSKPLQLQQMTVQDTKRFQFRPLIVQGNFDSQRTFLLDNQFYHHQLGYHVLTPFHLANEKKVILVNRGWIAATKLSTLTTPKETITLQGYIDFPTAGFRLSKQLNNPLAWPRIIEILNLTELGKQMEHDVYPFVIKLLAAEPYGCVREWSQVTTMSPQRHQAYAFQWFAMALAVLIIFLSTNSMKIENVLYDS